MVIVHKDPSLTMKSILTTPQGERTQERQVSLGGIESARELEGGGKVLTRARWEGEKLIFQQSLDAQHPVVETWSLSPDRKTLTFTRTLGSSTGPLSSRMIFDRVERK